MEYITSTERRGMKKGAISIAFRLLQRRVGTLDETLQTHIRALPLEQIEELSDALLYFSSLADLTAWLQQHPLPATATV